jgi:chloramphenicol O-acetyltransferase
VNNRSFNFRRSDGSIHIGVFPQCEEDREVISVLNNDYNDSIDQFIDLILESIDQDSENGEFSLYTAAHLCFNSTEAERDEFLAIVTPYNQCVIMIGLFYNCFYF